MADEPIGVDGVTAILRDGHAVLVFELENGQEAILKADLQGQPDTPEATQDDPTAGTDAQQPGEVVTSSAADNASATGQTSE